MKNKQKESRAYPFPPPLELGVGMNEKHFMLNDKFINKYRAQQMTRSLKTRRCLYFLTTLS